MVTRTREKVELPPLEDMYQTWAIKVVFRDGIAGGMSLSKNTAKHYADLLASGSSNQLHKALKERGVIETEDIAAWMEQSTQIFPMDEDGQYIFPNQIASMLYQAGCKGNIPGIKTGNPGSALRGAGHVLPAKIYLQGELSTTIIEHPIQRVVKGVKGSAISIFELVEGAHLEFESKILRQPSHLPEDVYRRLWYLAQEEGLGSRRELTHGKFDLERCEVVETPTE